MSLRGEIMEYRQPKDNDDEMVRTAVKLLAAEIRCHKEIEQALWISAMNYISCMSYVASGISHEKYCDDIDNLKSHYKALWEEKC